MCFFRWNIAQKFRGLRVWSRRLLIPDIITISLHFSLVLDDLYWEYNIEVGNMTKHVPDPSIDQGPLKLSKEHCTRSLVTWISVFVTETIFTWENLFFVFFILVKNWVQIECNSITWAYSVRDGHLTKVVINGLVLTLKSIRCDHSFDLINKLHLAIYCHLHSAAGHCSLSLPAFAQCLSCLLKKMIL